MSDKYPNTPQGSTHPDLPKFEDEFKLQRPQNGQAPGAQPNYPTIGERDRLPVGAYPEMKPYLDPLAGSSDGGMIPTPNHPIFNQPHGSPGPGRVPGARFDDPTLPHGMDMEMIGSGLPGNVGGNMRPGNAYGPGYGGRPGFSNDGPPGFGRGSGGNGFGGGFGGGSGGPGF
ncbi:hypothetical protein BABINDRAFT_10034 [Babjeviella inositovora NRRL Y-12698]|uniref:PI31 proteasome regulator C-terminal domain-containing protein n=1 Tax=Babjeviella inositovora NRRL Y-12698 TaxID=984486 RepID=A0A1E3QL36_9ASCO|nr:uncharacterized protein BABINDRAFT_10034 [Babjeviella inositovora NRRL Y-12698]ODQ77707.1 hypothetical protein BABINDRAFT_10034 [Babjeviella inositovora NRRL Y-12698]